MRALTAYLLSLVVACGSDEPARPDAGAAADAAVDTAAAAPLTLVTVNARCLIDDWDARLPLLADGLVAANADVIGLQEVCMQPGGRDALEELVDALRARGATGFAFTRTSTHLAWDTYSEGLAILSRHPIGQVSVTSLPTAGIPRKLLAAHIETPVGARVVAVTHLDHQSTTTRAQQAQAIATTLDAIATGMPTMLVGDFNEAPGGGVSTTLDSAGFRDAWATLHPTDSGYTFPASGPTVRIDYVWTRGGAGTQAIERVFTAPAGSTYASDHLGIRAVLDL